MLQAPLLNIIELWKNVEFYREPRRKLALGKYSVRSVKPLFRILHTPVGQNLSTGKILF